MKKIVCEMCEGTEFAKVDGMFVCQNCGTKYSPEEAKALMVEVEGEMPSSVGSGQKQLDNILVLALNAYDADNKKEAENYCNKAIEIDALCYKAWFLKGKAVGWQSTIDNLRIEEAAHSFCRAIDAAPEEEKEDLRSQAVNELKKLGVALISLRKNRFSNSPDSDELIGFTNDRKVMLDSLMVLLKHGNFVKIPDGYLEEIATLMNEAGVAALKKARNAWSGVDHPSDKDLSTFIDWCSNIEKLFRQAIDVSKNDDEDDIIRYRNVAIALEEPIGLYSVKQYWDSFWNEYRWQKNSSLTDAAVESRKKSAREARAMADALEKKVNAEKAAKEAEEKRAAKEAKKKRIEAYWELHKEEKIKLDTEMEQLQSRKNALTDQLTDLENQITVIEAEGAAKVPSEIEEEGLHEQIKELRVRRSKLGLFARKDKKQIDEEIAVLETKASALKPKIQEEKNVQADETDKKLAPLKAKEKEYNDELKPINKRISEIKATLSKDPEEE